MTELCDDISYFKSILREMRRLDDNVIYDLNRVDPTGFQGKELPAYGRDATDCPSIFKRATEVHAQRTELINRCIKRKAELVEEQPRAGALSVEQKEALRTAARELSMMENESMVEEITFKRTMDLFKRKCRGFVQPK